LNDFRCHFSLLGKESSLLCLQVKSEQCTELGMMEKIAKCST
jgi:hypothetical protein